MQVQVFVSPFVEPAHVHVRVIALAEHSRTMGYEALGNWMFDLLEARLGEKGRPMPAGWTRRSRLAREMVPSGAAATCTPPAEGVSFISKWPGSLEGFHLLIPTFPGWAHAADGEVDVQATVLEDGAVIPMNVDTKARNMQDQFKAWGVQFAAFRLFAPAYVGSCPVANVVPLWLRLRNSSAGSDSPAPHGHPPPRY
jgi:hypothetical protein